jgi:hypothetical protein
MFQRIEPLKVENFSGEVQSNIGRSYTYPLRLQYRNYYSVESFEIGPTDQVCDAILPYWRS